MLASSPLASAPIASKGFTSVSIDLGSLEIASSIDGLSAFGDADFSLTGALGTASVESLVAQAILGVGSDSFAGTLMVAVGANILLGSVSSSSEIAGVSTLTGVEVLLQSDGMSASIEGLFVWGPVVVQDQYVWSPVTAPSSPVWTPVGTGTGSSWTDIQT